MGACLDNRKRKQPTIEQRIEETKKAILRVETQLSKVEYDIKSLGNVYFATTQNFTNSIKINDLKRDLVRNILKYQRLLKYKNTLKNNLDIMENKNEENKIVNELDLNNEILDNIDDGNAEKIQQNNYNLHGQNEQMIINNQLLDEGDPMKNLNVDAIINKFFNQTKK